MFKKSRMPRTFRGQRKDDKPLRITIKVRELPTYTIDLSSEIVHQENWLRGVNALRQSLNDYAQPIVLPSPEIIRAKIEAKS